MGAGGSIPLCLVFCENLSLGVVSNDLDVDEASKVQLLRPEHRHVGELCTSRALMNGFGVELVVELKRIAKSNALATVTYRGPFCQPSLGDVREARLQHRTAV